MYAKNWTENILIHASRTNASKGWGPVDWTTTITPMDYNVALDQFKTGSSVPHWRELIEEGKLAASPYLCQLSKISSIKPTTGGVVYLANPGISEQTESFSGIASIPTAPFVPPIPDATSNKALSRILSRCRDQYQHVNLLPALGELRQTISQFGAPASALISLTHRHVNKLELAARGLGGTTVMKRISWARIVASTYLEYAFGLAPLIEDTKATAEALARWKAEKEKDLPRPTSDYLTASASLESSSESFIGNANGLGLSLIDYDVLLTQKNLQGVRYKVKLKNSLQSDFGSNERLGQLLGFEPINFLPTMWEVLPWSWLIDYFLNIQQIIEAGVTHTQNVDWIIKSERSVSTLDASFPCRIRPYPGLSPRWLSSPVNSLGKWSTVATAFSRSLPESLGIPTLTVSYPNSVNKFANATAALFARRAHANSLYLF